MEDNTLLIVGALGLGMMFMMSQKNQQSQAPIYIPVPSTGGGYSSQPVQQQPTTGQKIVNTIQTGQSIYDAGKRLYDSIVGSSNSLNMRLTPSVLPSNWNMA